jgi:hypothetical protein
MPRFTVVRVTPPTGAESLKQRTLLELAKDVQQRLNLGQDLRGEVSERFQNTVFQATVLGDGLLVSNRALATARVRSVDDLLYPRSSLDDPVIRDTVSAAVGESLDDLDALLEKARR